MGGSINHEKLLPIHGLNAYNDRNYAHRDSLDLIERCTQTPVIATVQKHQRRLSCRADLLSIINAQETGGFDSEA